MKKALVVAGGISQAALIQDLKSRGIYTILADRNPKAYAVQFADAFFPVSTLDIDGIKQLAIDEKVDMVITACADQVLLVVAKVSEELGLPCYIDYNTAKLVSDKQYMKDVFVKNDIPTSRHTVMAQFDERKIEEFVWPLIVKPVDSYSSRGVKKCTNIESLKVAFDEAIHISRTGTAIVEEYVEGEEITVDVYVEGGKAHVLCTSYSDKIKDGSKFVIYRTKNPARLTDSVKAQIDDVAQKIANAFGLIDSPMLIQLITDNKRVSVLEFCARTGGGIKFRLIRKASGFDVIKAVVDLSLGKKPHVGELIAEKRYLCNVFFYCKPGVFDHFEGAEELLDEGVISEYYCFCKKGKEFVEISSSGDRVGVVTIQADSMEELRIKHDEAVKRVKAIGTDNTDLIRHDLVEELDY